MSYRLQENLQTLKVGDSLDYENIGNQWLVFINLFRIKLTETELGPRGLQSVS